jgi:hypothetical protein
MIGDGEKYDHRHFAVEPASVQVGVKTKPRAHKRRPKAKRPAKIVRGQHTVVDAF